MKKIEFLFLFLLLVITFYPFQTAEAKLLIIPPQKMIDGSDLIVIGTVTKKNYSEVNREVAFSIDTILKGDTKQKEIVLKRDKSHMYGWLGFDFPDEGKILVLLRQYELTGDTNSVAIVNKDDTVQLYHGATMGNWTPKHYEETYQVFIDKKNESKQDNAYQDSLQNSKEPVELAKKNYDVKVIAGIIVLCLILILVIGAYIQKKRGIG